MYYTWFVFLLSCFAFKSIPFIPTRLCYKPFRGVEFYCLPRVAVGGVALIRAKFPLMRLLDAVALDMRLFGYGFSVTYCFSSPVLCHNFFFTTFTGSDKLRVFSLCGFFVNAGWIEREVWDMFGVLSQGAIFPRRVLLDYGFKGFPLRKDFPLTGFEELHYSERKKRVLFNPVRLTQVYKVFLFKQNYWVV